MSRVDSAFALLVAVQAAHSAEEFYGRLYDVFPPARFVSGLVSRDLARGFLILNVTFIVFGVWCLIWPIRRRWPSAVGFVVGWIAIECLNALGHSGWSFLERAYTPGVATAPVLLIIAAYLALHLSELNVTHFQSSEEFFAAFERLVARLDERGHPTAAGELRHGLSCLNGLTDGWAQLLESIERVMAANATQFNEIDRRELMNIRAAVRQTVYRR